MDDVLGIDAGPHDDPQLGELGADLGQLDRKGLLGRVELGGSCEERSALGMERDVRLVTVRNSAVAGGITDRRHVHAPRRNETGRGKHSAVGAARFGTPP